MSLSPEDVKKTAFLARLNLSEQEIALYTPQLGKILDFIDQMNQVDTSTIQPISHSVDLPQRLREDVITETDQRSKFQAIAPQVESGLYLVPKVIEEVEKNNAS